MYDISNTLPSSHDKVLSGLIYIFSGQMLSTLRTCIRLIPIYDLVNVICYSEEAFVYCSWFARNWSACQVKCIGYIMLIFGFDKLAYYLMHIALRFNLSWTRFISCLVFWHFVLMKGPKALIKYIVFNFVFRSSFKQNATYKYVFIILLNTS